MELDQLHYLLALKKLYGLLQNFGNGLQNKISENLGENARLLLKHLLDSATERVLGSRSKIIAAAQSGASTTPCPSLTQPPKAAPNSNHPLSPPILIRRAFPSKASKPMVISELSKPTRISSNKLHHTRKPCRFCEQTGIKLQESAKETKNDQLSRNPFCGGVLQSGIENPIGKQKSIQVRNFSKDVSNAVKQIESRISALQLCTKSASSTAGVDGEPVDYVHGLRVRVPSPPMDTRMMLSPQLSSKHNPNSSREKNVPLQRPTLLYHHTTDDQQVLKSKLLPRQRHDVISSDSYLSSPHQQNISRSSSTSSLPSQTSTHTATASTACEQSSLVESSSSVSNSSPPYSVARRYRSGHRRNPEKANGRLRRFKNKLGLIFHHHHHHHHHHHNRDSMWKPLRKMFHHGNAHAVHEKKVFEKSTVANVPPRKLHAGHFKTLVEGLLRHAGRRRKVRKRIGCGGSKKVGKKLQWRWMFRRHGGVKLPKRRRGVRVGGFMRPKARLKMIT